MSLNRWFIEQVIYARLVLPDGLQANVLLTARHYSGGEMTFSFAPQIAEYVANEILSTPQDARLPSYHQTAGAVYGDPASSRVADTALVLLSRHGCIAVHPSRRLHARAIL